MSSVVFVRAGNSRGDPWLTVGHRIYRDPWNRISVAPQLRESFFAPGWNAWSRSCEHSVISPTMTTFIKPPTVWRWFRSGCAKRQSEPPPIRSLSIYGLSEGAEMPLAAGSRVPAPAGGRDVPTRTLCRVLCAQDAFPLEASNASISMSIFAIRCGFA